MLSHVQTVAQSRPHLRVQRLAERRSIQSLSLLVLDRLFDATLHIHSSCRTSPISYTCLLLAPEPALAGEVPEVRLGAQVLAESVCSAFPLSNVVALQH